MKCPSCGLLSFKVTKKCPSCDASLKGDGAVPGVLAGYSLVSTADGEISGGVDEFEPPSIDSGAEADLDFGGDMGGESATGMGDFDFVDSEGSGAAPDMGSDFDLDLSDAEEMLTSDSMDFADTDGAVGASLDFQEKGGETDDHALDFGAADFEESSGTSDADIQLDFESTPDTGEISLDFEDSASDAGELDLDLGESGDSGEIELSIDEPEIESEPALDLGGDAEISLDDEPALDLGDDAEISLDDEPALDLRGDDEISLDDEPALDLGGDDEISLDDEPALDLGGDDEISLDDEPALGLGGDDEISLDDEPALDLGGDDEISLDDEPALDLGGDDEISLDEPTFDLDDSDADEPALGEPTFDIDDEPELGGLDLDGDLDLNDDIDLGLDLSAESEDDSDALDLGLDDDIGGLSMEDPEEDPEKPPEP